MPIYKNPLNDDTKTLEECPYGWVEITHDELLDIIAARTPTTIDPQVVLASKKAQLRAAREGILNRLSGIALTAQLTGDTATTAAYITVRQGLLDITNNLPADATVDGVVMLRYAALVGACTPQMVNAFAQVDA